MAGLRKTLSSQGITLPQFGFQFIVILLGVYLAIVFEGKAEDRSRELMLFTNTHAEHHRPEDDWQLKEHPPAPELGSTWAASPT